MGSPATHARFGPRATTEPPGTPLRRSYRRKSATIALTTTLAGFLLSAWMALHSDGVHHDDDLVHYQMAAWSSEYPSYLLHSWGRPGFTVLYALPAQLGWEAARIFSGLLTALTGWLAYRIALRQGIGLAGWVPALLWLQPMTFTLSYTTLTEPVLALYLTLAMWLLLRRNYAWSAAVASLCMVTRHEGVLFVALWAAMLWMRRRPVREWIWLGWAPLLHNVLSAAVFGQAPLFMYLDPVPTEAYGQADWMRMIALWPLASGSGPIVLACAGAPLVWRRPGGRLWVLCGAAYVAAPVVVYRFGLFASGGYYRFLISAGPVVAVAAAAALTQCHGALRASFAGKADARRRADVRRVSLILAATFALLWTAIEMEVLPWLEWVMPWVRYGGGAAIGLCCMSYLLNATRSAVAQRIANTVLPAGLLALTIWQPLIGRGIQPPFQQCAPLVLREDQFVVREAADWLRANGLADRHIIAANAWVRHFLGITLSPFQDVPNAALEKMKPGDVLVWDANYCPSPDHRIYLEDLRSRSDLIELWHGREHPGPHFGVYCRVFEKRGAPTSNAAQESSR
jgi:hypothetical protein